MRIGINGFEAVIARFGYSPETGLPNRVGSSQYCYELLINLYKLDKKNEYEIFLPISPTNDLPEANEKWKYTVIPQRKLWTLTALSPHLFSVKKNIDVFFSPTHYLPIFAPRKSVVSILDISYIYFPKLFKRKDLFQLKRWTAYSARHAKKILTISESSKNDIINEYHQRAEKIEVVYPGMNTKLTKSGFLDMNELKDKFSINKKYILFVGTLQPRKNITRLIEAFSKIDDDVKLVIVGKKGWQFDEIIEAPEKYGIKEKVIFLNNVGDDDLPSLYKNAEFFILPSLYEGFGLPVLEAMSYGTAVITSNISSLPEVGGDAALYVNPNDANDIALKIKKLLEDEGLRRELVAKGKKQVESFSWEKSARETLKVLEEVANG